MSPMRGFQKFVEKWNLKIIQVFHELFEALLYVLLSKKTDGLLLFQYAIFTQTLREIKNLYFQESFLSIF